MENRKKIGFTSFSLHIIAMTAMLIDHMYHTVFLDKVWMNGIGRIAFPIFAFMIVEGYHHTKDVKKYMKRLLIFALVSEIPFDLMIGSTVFYPFYQNVMWTFIIALSGIMSMEKIKTKYKDNRVILYSLICITVILSYLTGMLAFVDYFGYGVLTVFVFYFFREKKWSSAILQIITLGILNIIYLGKYSPLIYVGGFGLPIQSLALLSLPIIWLYNGERGYHNNFIKYSFYIFYPLHMLILGIILLLIY